LSLRIAFYSHNGFGLGHVRRNLKLAQGLLRRRPNADVLILTGAAGLHEFALPSSIDYLKLPSVRKMDAGRWRPRTLDIEMENLLKLRRTIILEAVRAYRPHLFVADFLPQGVEGELVPALQELAVRKDAWTAIGFRDVLDEPAAVRDAWDTDGSRQALDGLYDTVLVYGQPEWFDFASAYGLDASLPRYVGLLGEPGVAARPRPAGDVRILATSGGGADGYAVLAAALEALEPLRARLGGSVRCTCLTGPLMPDADVERLRAIGKRVDGRVVRFANDLPRKLARMSAVIGMGGYNTVCDILSYRRPAVIVPRPGPSREQPIRARILANRGLAATLALAECTASAVAESLEAELRRDSYPEDALPALDGTSRAVDALLELVE
jgi:predicted glycosyltransferase